MASREFEIKLCLLSFQKALEIRIEIINSEDNKMIAFFIPSIGNLAICPAILFLMPLALYHLIDCDLFHQIRIDLMIIKFPICFLKEFFSDFKLDFSDVYWLSQTKA